MKFIGGRPRVTGVLYAKERLRDLLKISAINAEMKRSPLSSMAITAILMKWQNKSMRQQKPHRF